MQNIALVAIFSLLVLGSPLTSGQALCRNGELRLTDGPNSLAGRLEVCFNNQWGTVCADSRPWTQSNAAVVCKQLGHSHTGAIAPKVGYYGSGSDKIHLSEIMCSGSENHLTECQTSLVGKHDCNHNQDVAVVCQGKNFSCDNGDIRLVGGGSANNGRVEVCYGNLYGTVCDDFWDTTDANVVCRQLGFKSEGAIALRKAAFGPGYGPVYLDDLKCNGNEPHISLCSHTGVSNSNCQHSEDAGVICKPLDPPCEDGSVRLVNGRLPCEGRIETCYNGVWGTICHDLWDNTDAGVVCSQLGYSAEGARATKYADFGLGDGVIFLESVRCDGSEQFLNECISDPLTVHNCGHHKDAGVICQDPSSTCSNGDVRLSNSSQSNAGRVEICYNNHYGTICEDKWTTEDANIVCGQLGFEKHGAVALTGNYYGEGVGIIYLDNLECKGDEKDLLQCPHNGLGVSNCFHDQDAAVICKQKELDSDSCTDSAVRLVGGAISSEGRVEVCINGVWGGVCDSGWDNSDATVVCKQLEYSQDSKSIAVPGGHYHPLVKDIPMLFSNVSCIGSEDRIMDCANTDIKHIGGTSCSNLYQAGVICSPTDPICGNGDVHLVGGVSSNQGRVEVCHNGVWGTVSGEEAWSHEEAAVVCHQLGYNLSETRPVPVAGGGFGIGTGPVFLSDVHCYGNENKLTDCKGATVKYQTISHPLAVGVVCVAYPCTNGETRLNGGTHGREGRLEVCRNGVWNLVCASDVSHDQAKGICNHLGLSPSGSYALPGLFSGVSVPVSGSAVSGSFSQCATTGSGVTDCLRSFSNNQLTADTCGQHNSIGIICQEPTTSGTVGLISKCQTGDVRLVGGDTPTEGRVEVCLGGEWGTVCDDSWDDKAASVVCNQLGHTSSSNDSVLAIAVGGGHFGLGTGGIFLDNMRCDGTEPDLLHCLLKGVRSHNCHHSEDAGVKCAAAGATPGDLVPTDETTVNTSEGEETDIGDNTNMDNMEESVASSESNDLHHIIIPTAAMATSVIIFICITIVAILIYKWRRLKLVMSDSELKFSVSTIPLPQTPRVGSPLPQIV